MKKWLQVPRGPSSPSLLLSDSLSATGTAELATAPEPEEDDGSVPVGPAVDVLEDAAKPEVSDSIVFGNCASDKREAEATAAPGKASATPAVSGTTLSATTLRGAGGLRLLGKGSSGASPCDCSTIWVGRFVLSSGGFPARMFV